MAAAKKEGKVVWYCSVPIETAQKVANMFEQKTGIKVELFRSGGSNILRRFQQEADAGKVFVDVLTHSEPAAARVMTKKGLFVAFKADRFRQGAGRGQGSRRLLHRAAAQRHGDVSCATTRCRRADRPKTWGDLVQPKYKGKMVMADPSFSSLLVTIVGMLAKEHGWEYFEKLRSQRHHAGRRQPAGRRHGQARRARHRGRRRRRLCRRQQEVGDGDFHALSAGRRLRHSVAELDREGFAAIPTPPRRSPNSCSAAPCRNCSRRSISIPRAPTSPGPDGSPPLGEIKIHPIDYDYIEAESSRIKKRFSEVLQ